ncbi:MAG: virulence RhuM family protein [Spirochaetales bacterium]|jgi:hypothetical protein|nr:virulence RhuM family protein [Spirochaetales bacterium]
MVDTSEIIIYKTSDGTVKLNVHLENESVWLSQEQMAQLFGKGRSTITEHISNIFTEGELIEEVVCRDFRHTTQHGALKGKTQTKNIKYYNLDMIISMGYRVRSPQGTQFRIWATQRLKEYIVKGFTMDDERLKEPQNDRYFEELLARIRDIRSSEKVICRKDLEIKATIIDYDGSSQDSRLFFKQIQNKMHWATPGHTAAELIYQRADASQQDMGITNYTGNKLLKRDVEVAKNYLNEEELNILNRIVTAYLEMAEVQALNKTPMTMADWLDRLQQFLTMTGRELLTHSGTISHGEAMKKAHGEYQTFCNKQLANPTEVEIDFIEVEKELTPLTKNRKQQ